MEPNKENIEGKVVFPSKPPMGVPTIFIDGFANVAPSEYVVRTYMWRFDPSPDGGGLNDGDQSGTVVAQVVMPTLAFLQTAAFFENTAKAFVSRNPELRKIYDEMKLSIERENDSLRK